MAEEASQCRNVYIIGAQSTGKTTLVDNLEEKFGRGDCGQPGEQIPKPIIIREVARTVLREKNFNRDDITNSSSKALQLQNDILEAQMEAEKAAANPTILRHEAAEDMLASETWQKLEGRMKAGIVILCEAGCGLLMDDGTRLMPDGDEGWMRIDNVFRELLAAREIDYVVCSKNLTSLADRVQLVKEQLALSIASQKS